MLKTDVAVVAFSLALVMQNAVSFSLLAHASVRACEPFFSRLVYTHFNAIF